MTVEGMRPLWSLGSSITLCKITIKNYYLYPFINSLKSVLFEQIKWCSYLVVLGGQDSVKGYNFQND